ncbi:MAG: winged helix-turn-helix transcriptional regulator [Candidatus Thermoplasmatota archaeon]|nr:winged helix-turn-helix transcriptional regulator [Candidatus Thermoplasmatota archaeon]
MSGQSLRDLKRNTEMLILVELVVSPATKLKDISKNLGITVQAVSQYVASMRREGLVRDSGGKLKPTRRGMQMLQEHFTGLKLEVDSILRRIRVVDACVAIAAKRITKGQHIGLEMEDGMLMAFPEKRASSMGIASESAEEGDDVLVRQLEGIVDMELGSLLVVEAPSESEGGSKKARVASARAVLDDFSPGLLVAGDMTGAALLMKAAGEMFTIHAPVESAMSALSKGVDVAFCGTRESVDQMLEAVSDLRKETGYEIKRRSYKA